MECSTAVYPESFMASVPVVTSDLPFARELCQKAAVFVSPFAEQDAAAGLCRVLDDADLRATLSATGREVLKDRYCSADEKWRAQAAMLEEVVSRDHSGSRSADIGRAARG